MIHVLRNAEVYAPEPRGLLDLVVAGEQIVWMGDGLPALPSALATHEMDLGGRRLVPGFIDGHAHLTGGGGEAGPESRVPPLALSALTRGGITTAVGVLGTDDVTRTTAELVATARGLTQLGLTAFCHTGGYHVPPTTLTGSVRGDIALVDPIIGIGEIAVSDHRSSQPTLDELLRLASEAHVAGLMSGKAGILHLHVGDGARGLDLVRDALDRSEIPPRVFNPTHVNRRRGLFEEALELADRGVTIDVTAFPVSEGDDAWDAADALVRYWDAGLPTERITISSDGGGCLPSFDPEGRVTRCEVGSPSALAETLARLLAGGHALEQALPPFTANPATLLKLSGKGRIAVGMDADLVVLDAKGGIDDVMARGRWHLRNRRATVRGPFEGASP
ncbi:MAG TPA: beta-aspartyl-peptidase [Gemmatimonadales bacterium]|nr:beta-aspartyl-peptidase [Gemmatimonadales bacterium]